MGSMRLTICKYSSIITHEQTVHQRGDTLRVKAACWCCPFTIHVIEVENLLPEVDLQYITVVCRSQTVYTAPGSFDS